ncbi:MAG: hypothetical protein IJE09_03735 [Oscillospiraceae bacterium]|nr:hypothetical protein [Oscillospiraceae bacterium]
MARVQEFYKGRRKRRNHALIPFIVLLLLFSLAMVLFYGMQKYAVITDDGVSVELPILKEPGATTVDSSGREIKNFPKIQTEIVFDEPNYSGAEANPEPYAPPVRAIFVPAENISRDKLLEYAARLVSGNALLLEMKPRSGETLWESKTQMAMAYSLSAPTERTAQMPELIQMLKDEGIYLVAQISCCIDETLPTRTTAYCIATETGFMYRDEKGTWLDAYNLDLRTWIAEMVQELYDLGFDEVVLADLAHPTLPEENPPVLRYTREISTERSTDLASCGLAAGIAKQLENRGEDKVLSIYCDSLTSLVKTDTSTGQNGPYFMKLYDRVYLKTDKYAYSYNVADMQPNTQYGNVYDRLVPVVDNYIPENTSWILVDVEEEED